jgi:hypothetical protein
MRRQYSNSEFPGQVTLISALGRFKLRWQIRCAIDSAKAVLPFQAQLRLVKDFFIPYRLDLDRDKETLREGLQQVKWIADIQPIKGLSVLEIGSGWQPLIPFLYILSGASKVFLTDLNVLLRPETFAGALKSLRSHREMILAALNIDPETFDFVTRQAPEISFRDRLNEMHLEYMAPCDCRRLSLAAESLDLITSRACLEHIPPEIIQDIFHESYRLLKRGAWPAMPLICPITGSIKTRASAESIS